MVPGLLFQARGPFSFLRQAVWLAWLQYRGRYVLNRSLSLPVCIIGGFCESRADFELQTVSLIYVISSSLRLAAD